MPGLELEDIMVGISVCRNQDLANVFYLFQGYQENGKKQLAKAEWKSKKYQLYNYKIMKVY